MYSYAVSVNPLGNSPNPVRRISDSVENDAEMIIMHGTAQNMANNDTELYEMTRRTTSPSSSLTFRAEFFPFLRPRAGADGLGILAPTASMALLILQPPASE